MSKRQLLPFIALTCLLMLTGCQKHDSSSIEWQPNSFMFDFTETDDGLYTVTAGVPVGGIVNTMGAITESGIHVPIESMGNIGISHTFNFSEDCTYIIIRNRAKGIDQVFKVGVLGEVILMTSGEHKLVLTNESENRFVIEDISNSPMTIQFIPTGKELSEITLGGAAKCIFLVNHYLRVEYPSLSHPRINPFFFLMPTQWFRPDDVICLDSIKSVSFDRNYLVQQLIFNWKDAITQKQNPVVIDLPSQDRSSDCDEMKKFQTALALDDRDVTFEKTLSEESFQRVRTKLTWILGGFSLVLVPILLVGRGGDLAILLLVWGTVLCLTLVEVRYIYYASDMDYWKMIFASHHGFDCRFIQFLFQL